MTRLHIRGAREAVERAEEWSQAIPTMDMVWSRVCVCVCVCVCTCKRMMLLHIHTHTHTHTHTHRTAADD